MAPSQRRTQPVYEITGIAANRQADLQSRARRYMFSMSVRTVCFVAAVIATGWARWVLIVGALVLPYVAVLIANAGRESGGSLGDRLLPPVPVQPSRQLGAGDAEGPTVPGQATTSSDETQLPDEPRPHEQAFDEPVFDKQAPAERVPEEHVPEPGVA